MRDQIQSALAQIEREEDVRVLYACESGSRAWGFASQNSDYDVRFIYVHRREWYLSIEEGRDVIEKMLPNDLDVSGWDLRKALQLLRKSNPPLLEWLSSPIVYKSDPQFFAEFTHAARTYYSPSSCFSHYLHMADGNVRGYLQGEQIRIKKYLYVLRPMLACRWIEQGRGAVPMEFADLFVTLEGSAMIDAIRALVDRKMAGEELDSGPRDPVISGFIDAEMERLTALPRERSPLPDPEMLNEIFRRAVS